MWRATVRGLLGHKLRFALTALAVGLGVAFMAGTMVLTDTIGRNFDDLFADVSAGTDAVVRAEEAFDDGMGGAMRPTVPSGLVRTVREVDGVRAAEGGLEGYAQFVDREGDAIGNPAQGAPTLGFGWPTVPELNPFELVAGRAPEHPNEVVMDRGSAEEGGFDVGDRVKVLLQGPTREFTVVGIVSFGTADSPLGASVALFDPESAARYLGEIARYDEISVVAAEGVTQEELVERLGAVLPQGVEAITGAEYIEENQSEIRASLSFFNTFLLVFALVALFVGSFIIFNTFSIVVAQRTRELALLRAVGATRRQVLASVLGEAVVVGLLASAGGLLAGIGLAAGLKALLGSLGIDIPAGGTVVSPRTVVAALLVGTVVTALAAVAPARRAGRVAPVAALRDVAVEEPRVSTRRVGVGAVVTAVGLVLMSVGLFGDPSRPPLFVGVGAAVVFLGVSVLGPVVARPVGRLLGSPLPRLRGMTGTIARENALRSPRRTSSTASALMIGVGLVGFVSIFAASANAVIDRAVDQVVKADLILASGNFGGGFSPTLAERVAEVPGVEQVSGVRFGAVEVGGNVSRVLAVEPGAVDSLFDVGVVAGRSADLADGGLGVYEGLAEERGWELGEVVAVRFADTGTEEFEIRALFSEREVAGNYVMALGDYAANVADQLDFAVYVDAAASADVAEVRGRIEAIVDSDYPNADVQDQTEFKEAQAGQVGQLLNLVYALLLLAIVIALIGIANTLALSIFERTRELGLLRAVGMTRGQVRSAVRWESVIIALFGTVLGLVVAVTFGWAMVRALADEGFDTLVVPAGRMAIIVLLAALAGVVAAIGPARRASKLDVIRAVTVE